LEWCRAATWGAAVIALTALATEAGAQRLPLKTALAAAGVTGCTSFVPEAPRATASNPAIQGEHIAARDAFSKAASLVPNNAQVAYYLGREHEALKENGNAVRQYCRYLALQPRAADADEVRGRIVRLTPTSELARVEEAKANFQTAVALLRRRQYAAADSVFGYVAQQVPSAPEPFFNRALARAAQGDRANAMQDFEKYLALAPQAADRVTIRDALPRLPDRVYNPGQAFVSGLAVPGLGQMSTGRPMFGVVALGTVGAAVALAMRTEDRTETRTYTDPFGQPYTDTVTLTRRPQLVAGLATAGAVWLGAALESIAYARRSRARAEAIIARDININVRSLGNGRLAVGLRIR
jgi:tetratricopeptide (TPR) repeat protein